MARRRSRTRTFSQGSAITPHALYQRASNDHQRDVLAASVGDGSTACGCWLYSGCRAERVNQTARRKPGREQSWVAPDWGWAWPANRRILYNRASADPEGRPWSERKKYVWCC